MIEGRKQVYVNCISIARFAYIDNFGGEDDAVMARSGSGGAPKGLTADDVLIILRTLITAKTETSRRRMLCRELPDGARQ